MRLYLIFFGLCIERENSGRVTTDITWLEGRRKGIGDRMEVRGRDCQSILSRQEKFMFDSGKFRWCSSGPIFIV